MGLVLVVMGFQLRTVDTFILNQKTSDFIEKKIKSSAIVSPSPYEATAYALPGLTAQAVDSPPLGGARFHLLRCGAGAAWPLAERHLA